MARTATLYHFSIQLADSDREVYTDCMLRVAQQPSETAAFMLLRVLAYCLEFEEGIALTEGVAATDEAAVVVRDLTGRVTKWIEVGAPDAERVHRGSKLAGRAAVYTHRDPKPLLAQYEQAHIHRAAQVPVHAFERAFLTAAAERVQRRSALAVSRSGGELYLDIDGESQSSAIHCFNAAGHQ